MTVSSGNFIVLQQRDRSRSMDIEIIEPKSLVGGKQEAQIFRILWIVSPENDFDRAV
jgi:hypothetical protein